MYNFHVFGNAQVNIEIHVRCVLWFVINFFDLGLIFAVKVLKFFYNHICVTVFCKS